MSVFFRRDARFAILNNLDDYSDECTCIAGTVLTLSIETVAVASFRFIVIAHNLIRRQPHKYDISLALFPPRWRLNIH